MINGDGPTLLEKIPEYESIIKDLSKGKINPDNFNLCNRKSKLSHTLSEILFDVNNDELSNFILFLDAYKASDLVKFLLDLNNFESSVKNRAIIKKESSNTAKIHYNTLDEALSIFKKYISKDAKLSIEIPDSLITETITKICPEDNEPIEQNCFSSVKQFVLNEIQKLYFDKYVLSEYHNKYVYDILDSRNLTLYDILYDDLAVVFFLEFLEQENVSDLLKFFVQAEMFSRNLESRISFKDSFKSNLESFYKQWQDDAMAIYDNFISLQAKRPLGFDSLIRRQVELNISIDFGRDEQEPEHLASTYSNCFYVPMLIVFCILDKVYFGAFLKSHMYQKYKNEILANTKSHRVSDEFKCSLDQHDEISESTIESNASQTTSYMPLNTQMPAHEDSIWNLSEPSIAELNLDSANSYSLNNFKKKFERFRKNLVLFNSERKAREDEEAEYEMAERVAAQLISDVIMSNQT